MLLTATATCCACCRIRVISVWREGAEGVPDSVMRLEVSYAFLRLLSVRWHAASVMSDLSTGQHGKSRVDGRRCHHTSRGPDHCSGRPGSTRRQQLSDAVVDSKADTPSGRAVP